MQWNIQPSIIGLIPYAIAYALKKCWVISQNKLAVMQMYNSKGPNPIPSTKTLAAAVHGAAS
jgi:hypothetical protein